MPSSFPSKLVFVDVDTQADFVFPDGKLAVPGAQQLIPQWTRLMEFAQQHHVPVISSVDAHAPMDPEFTHFPPHCIRGTPGQQKIPATLLPQHRFIPNEPNALQLKPGTQQWILEKQKFDLFTNVNASELFEKVTAGEYVVFGVATDYCVNAAVRGLLQIGRNVAVVKDAIQGIDATGSEAAIKKWQEAGARLVTTNEIVAPSGST